MSHHIEGDHVLVMLAHPTGIGLANALQLAFETHPPHLVQSLRNAVDPTQLVPALHGLSGCFVEFCIRFVPYVAC